MKDFGPLDKPFSVMKGRNVGDLISLNSVSEPEQNEVVLLSDLTRFSLGYLKRRIDGMFVVISIPWQNK